MHSIQVSLLFWFVSNGATLKTAICCLCNQQLFHMESNVCMCTDHIANGHLHKKHIKQHNLFALGKFKLSQIKCKQDLNSAFCVYFLWVNPCDIVANVLECDLIVSEFELQSRYYIHFQTNTLGKHIYPLIHPSYGLNSTTTILLQANKKKANNVWYVIKQRNQTCFLPQ